MPTCHFTRPAITMDNRPGNREFMRSGNRACRSCISANTTFLLGKPTTSGMVERQFRASIKMTGDIWYTAWVDAGQPDLKSLIHYQPSEEELKEKEEEVKKWKEQKIHVRDHESGPD